MRRRQRGLPAGHILTAGPGAPQLLCEEETERRGRGMGTKVGCGPFNKIRKPVLSHTPTRKMERSTTQLVMSPGSREGDLSAHRG